jgi:chromosome segregation ATPase
MNSPIADAEQKLAHCDAQCKEYEEGNRFLRAEVARLSAPSKPVSEEVERVEKLLDDLRAIPDQIALIEDELRHSIGQLLVDPQDTELTTRVAEALYGSNPLCVGDDGQTLLEFTEVEAMKPHVHARLMADARAAIQAMAEALR